MQELDRAGQAKAAMFPQAHPSSSSRDPQDPSHHLYVTSHGAYGAGEQRHRHYDWDRTGLNPATHSFGEALHTHISLSLYSGYAASSPHHSLLYFYVGHSVLGVLMEDHSTSWSISVPHTLSRSHVHADLPSVHFQALFLKLTSSLL